MRKFVLIATAIIFYIVGCTKIESTTIGAGLIPPVDGVNTFDTILEVNTNTFLDSMGFGAKIYRGDDHIIGIIDNDPIFGTTKATTYLELKPTYYKYAFPATTSLIADSVVLILSYRATFGDSSITSTPQEWEVREVTDSIKNDSIYNVSTKFTTAATKLGSKIINISSLRDSVNYGFENAKNQIRIKLDPVFATRLISNYDSTVEYANDSAFRAAFKGFAIGPKAGAHGNALVRINLLDTNTKLALFYNYKKADTATVRTFEVSYFRFSQGIYTTSSASANYIERQRTGSTAEASFSQTTPDKEVYIQTNPGTFATIKIPGLAAFPNSIIHRAELIMVQMNDPSFFYKQYNAPRFLLLSRYDTLNKVKRNVPNDFVVSSGQDNFSTFGGYTIDRNLGGTAIKSYEFDLSRYVQGIVTRHDTAYTLRLSAPSNDSLSFTSPYPSNVSAGIYYLVPTLTNHAAIGSVILGGGDKASADPYRMRLRIIYSKI